MKGSTNVSVGYTKYEAAATALAFSGYDTENDSDPATDWAECQANAYTIFRGDTTLAAPFGYGGQWWDDTLKGVLYDYYGSRAANIQLGIRMEFNINNSWKTSGQAFKLAISGARGHAYWGGSSWINDFEDTGRVYFRMSENPNLFVNGLAMLYNFGVSDFYIDAAELNNAQRAAGKQFYLSVYPAYMYKDVPKAFIQAMTGTTLYIYAYTPYYYDTYWVPDVSAYIKWILWSRYAKMSTYY